MDALSIAPTAAIPYLICLILPVFTFLLIALIKEKRRYKAPIYFGFFAAIVVIIILYIFLPIIVTW